MKTTVMSVQSISGFNWKMVLRAVGIAYIWTFSFIAILAAFLAWTGLSESSSAIALVGVAMLSNIIGGAIIARKARSNGWINGAVGGTMYMLMLYLIGAIFYGSMSVNANTFVMLAICLFSGAVGGIVGVNTKNKNKR